MSDYVNRNAWIVDRPALLWATLAIAGLGIIAAGIALATRPKPVLIHTGHAGRGQLQTCRECHRVHENDGPICLYCGEGIQ